MDSNHPEFLNSPKRVVLGVTGARFYPQDIFPAKGPLREAAPFDSGAKARRGAGAVRRAHSTVRNAIARTISHPTMTSETTAPAVIFAISFKVIGRSMQVSPR